MKKILSAVAISMVLTTWGFAMDVPTAVVVQNLNGSQQYMETYTVDPTVDASTLIKDVFDHEGYQYTYATMTKEEVLHEETKEQSEVVVVETKKDKLDEILGQLAPTMDYESEDGFIGVLSLDHNSLDTKPAGYQSYSYTATTTKEIPNLPSNDMSYVPGTASKNGMTLPLSGVEWQVQGSSPIGDVLVPSQYKAVATYSAPASYSAATGYLTAATYTGQVSTSQVEAITYTVTYLGEKIPEPTPSVSPEQEEVVSVVDHTEDLTPWLIWSGIGVVAIGLIVTTLFAIRRKKNTYVESEETYET